MKNLYTYLECDAATPGNTMGMGNPGEISPDTLSEPIHTAKAEKEKITIDEPERKKKKKKHVKSLAESLFDKDLTKQDVCIGNVYSLDEWNLPGVQANTMSVIEDSFYKPYIWKAVASPTWKKFLKRFDFQSEYPMTKLYRFMNMDLFYVLTWITFCCSSKEEIKEKTIAFLKSIKPYKDTNKIKSIEVFPMDFRDDLRMIVFRFKTGEEEDIIPCFTVNKKDWKG